MPQSTWKGSAPPPSPAIALLFTDRHERLSAQPLSQRRLALASVLAFWRFISIRPNGQPDQFERLHRILCSHDLRRRPVKQRERDLGQGLHYYQDPTEIGFAGRTAERAEAVAWG